MGLGCSRRVDRPCRAPGVCGRFIDCWTPHEVRVRVGGPADHPAQGLGDMGDWLYRIVSLLVYDAERALAHLLVPAPDEHWTDPVLRIGEGTAHVYATPAAERAGTADRRFPVDGPQRPHRA